MTHYMTFIAERNFNYASAIIMAANTLSIEAHGVQCTRWCNIQTACRWIFAKKSRSCSLSGLYRVAVFGVNGRRRKRCLLSSSRWCGSQPIVCQVQRRVTVGNRKAELRLGRNWKLIRASFSWPFWRRPPRLGSQFDATTRTYYAVNCIMQHTWYTPSIQGTRGFSKRAV